MSNQNSPQQNSQNSSQNSPQNSSTPTRSAQANLSQNLLRLPSGLLAGVIYPLRAIWTLLRNPPLQRYVLFPIAINVILGITLYATLLTSGFRLIDAIALDVPNWTAQLPAWSHTLPQWHVTFPDWMTHLPALPLPDWHLTAPDWLRLPDWQWSRPTLPDWFSAIPGWLAIALLWVLRLVLTLILLLITGLILLQFGVLLGAPWYGKLSEELEKMQTGQVTIIEVGLVKDIWRAILYELKKLLLSLGLGIPLLFLTFVPTLAVISTPISIALGSTIVCLDFIDGALERRRYRFRDKLKTFFRALPASGSFGLICFFLVSIPFINLIAIPICVTAGTLFFCDWIYPTLPTPTAQRLPSETEPS